MASADSLLAIYEVMTWTYEDADGEPATVPFMTEDLPKDVVVPPAAVVKDKVPTYGKQENAKDSPWHACRSGLSLVNLKNLVMLQNIGCPLEFDSDPEFAECQVLWSMKTVKDVTDDAAASAVPGREYNGVTLNWKTGEMDVFRCRADANLPGAGKPLRLAPADEEREFAFARNPALRKAILASQNRRPVQCIVPLFSRTGTVIKATLPWIPKAMYQRLVAEEAKKPAGAAKGKGKGKMIVEPEPEPEPEPEAEVEAPAPQPPKRKRAPPKKKPAAIADMLDATPAKVSPVATAMFAEAAAPDKVAVGKRKRATEQYAANVKKHAAAKLTADDAVTTLAELDQQYEALRASGRTWFNPFAGHKTYGDMLSHDISRYAIASYFAIKNAFDKRPLPQPAPSDIIPANMPATEVSDLL